VKAKNRLDRNFPSAIFHVSKYPFLESIPAFLFFSLGIYDRKIEFPKNQSMKPPWDFEALSEALVKSIPPAQKPALINPKEERNHPWQSEKLEHYGCTG
jgi:hypothetical protein